MEELEQRVDSGNEALRLPQILRGTWDWGYNAAIQLVNSGTGAELMFGVYLLGEYMGLC
jgi:hypothetical protein